MRQHNYKLDGQGYNRLCNFKLGHVIAHWTFHVILKSFFDTMIVTGTTDAFHHAGVGHPANVLKRTELTLLKAH